MLANLRILIVEDEPFVALDLADAVAARGGIVVGPALSISQALALIAKAPPDAAVLDAMLPDNDISPVCVILTECGVPFVLYTGTGLPPVMRDWEQKPPVVLKPLPVEAVMDSLEAELRNRWIS